MNKIQQYGEKDKMIATKRLLPNKYAVPNLNRYVLQSLQAFNDHLIK